MKRIIIFIIVLLLIIIGYFLFNNWLDFEDSPLTRAERTHPLDNNHPYIIIKTDSSGAQEEKNPPIVYAIIEPNEPHTAGSLSERRIGQSRVNLEEYVNKQVYIDGEYYEGQPLLLREIQQDTYGFLIVQPVIKINNLILVK
ncbi:hypothetical protein MUP32_00560 [Candidatus Microgenomates bacterium]|nr:hypothetical protein [Candidatus Microgenomates bacterium]